jgi:hypothetical protein
MYSSDGKLEHVNISTVAHTPINTLLKLINLTFYRSLLSTTTRARAAQIPTRDICALLYITLFVTIKKVGVVMTLQACT